VKNAHIVEKSCRNAVKKRKMKINKNMLCEELFAEHVSVFY